MEENEKLSGWKRLEEVIPKGVGYYLFLCGQALRTAKGKEYTFRIDNEGIMWCKGKDE